MEFYTDYMGRGYRKQRKPKRAPSAYNNFVKHYMLQGYNMADVAELWHQHKAQQGGNMPQQQQYQHMRQQLERQHRLYNY